MADQPPSNGWLRTYVLDLAGQVRDLRDSISSLALKMATLESKLTQTSDRVDHLPEEMDEQRAARSWKGWSKWVTRAISAIVISLAITGLTLWVFGQASNIGITHK